MGSALPKVAATFPEDCHTADSWGFTPCTAQSTNRPVTAAHGANLAATT